MLRVYPNYDCRAASDAVALVCPEDGRTVQADRAEADINELVRRFGLTGHLPLVQVPPTYQEFSEVFDFQSAMNLINAAEASFMALPADIRGRFQNDAASFVEFCSKAENLDEMRRMGLAVPAKVDDKGVPVPVVGDPLPADPA